LGKMRAEDSMNVKHDAVEFFMEVCQMSKNMQMGARYSLYESINQPSLIEILAETYNIYYPDLKTLKFEAFDEGDNLVDYLVHTHKSEAKSKAAEDHVLRAAIEDFLSTHDRFDIKKLDLLKINAIEILINITQQQSLGTTNASIRAFTLCEDQRQKGYPFIKRLAAHLMYSHEQGIKI
jgi:hypothetical protein